MQKKTIAKAGILGVVLLGITECSIVNAPAVMADIKTTQSLQVSKPLNVMDHATLAFSRGSYEVITTEPWKKPEIASQKLSYDELDSLLRSVGFEGNGLTIAKQIVSLESGNRPYAHNDNPNTGDNSYGLFQINMFRGMEESRQKAYNLDKNEDLFDARTNAEIAYKISKGGTKWGAWTTYKKISG
jgi:hypothetical protein